MDAGDSCSPPSKPSHASSDSPVVFGRQEFKQDERNAIRELLQQKLGKEHLATRPGSAGVSFTYVESWKAIELANQIFGFNGWSSAVVDITPDYIEQSGKGRYSVGVTAVVKVMLKDGTYHEDVGYGMAEHPKKGSAIENAKKEAVSDARKRALRLFGNALGNCLYDKEHLQKLKSAKKGELGYLPPTVSNPAHDAERALSTYDQSAPPTTVVSASQSTTAALPQSSQSSQPQPVLAQPPIRVPAGYNANTANIAGGRQQMSFSPPPAQSRAVVAPPQQANGYASATGGEVPASEGYGDGGDDEVFLSAALMSEQLSPSSTPSPQYGNNNNSSSSSSGPAKRTTPDSGFGFQQQQHQQQQPYGGGARVLPSQPQQQWGADPKRPRIDG